ncbi:hypothetical protein pneo_cds_759 [Pandoravirus neocaledonia]|uniref:Uncharacterized protein n=1 Tax=Pandoravirus neocaledonia TaxID=2107708 RepID=A0A2U7UD57_9VIRU|nr:hypothetical protein pneo_cds_759 [Pandoravirus neocaledonia]AVK76366.1 hypothetical protein pneo_cds_759 [Pandoravirus neocaledonia]
MHLLQRTYKNWTPLTDKASDGGDDGETAIEMEERGTPRDPDTQPERPPPRVAGCLLASVVLSCLLALPVILGLCVFVPWFVVGIQPDMAIEARMVRAECLITGHTYVATGVSKDGQAFACIPGLGVVFGVVSESTVTATAAVATLRIDREASWMSADVARHYLDAHPINSTSACYYDADRPRDRVAMVNGIDGLGTSLAWAIVTSLAACLLCFCALCALGCR